MRINSALDFRHPSESHTLLKDSFPSLRYQRASAVVYFFSAAEPQEDWDQEPTYGLGL